MRDQSHALDHTLNPTPERLLAANGGVMAQPNAGALSVTAPGLPGGAEAHNSRVLSYFVGAGLPSDQVEGVYANSKVWLSEGNLPVTTAQQMIAYNSVVRRKVLGFPVINSVAWARFDDKNEVVAEMVYWPAIPDAVLADAKLLAETLGDPATAGSMLSKIPNGSKGPGKVVIRHTPFSYGGAFAARVAYDVKYKSGGAVAIRHFDISGAEFRMPEEQWAPTPKNK
jgi:hypothetical protein